MRILLIILLIILNGVYGFKEAESLFKCKEDDYGKKKFYLFLLILRCFLAVISLGILVFICYIETL